MPCCIAIIRFHQCKHSTLFKLGCTAQCSSICPLPEQKTLLMTKYKWRCEDCHNFNFNKKEDERALYWDKRVQVIEDEDDYGGGPSFYKNYFLPIGTGFSITEKASMVPTKAMCREQAVDLLRSREVFESCRVIEPVRLKQVEEIQWVEEWTAQYGKVLWDIHYEKRWDKQSAKERIKYLWKVKVWDLVVVRDVSMTRQELSAMEQKHWKHYLSNRASRPSKAGTMKKRRKTTDMPDKAWTEKKAATKELDTTEREIKSEAFVTSSTTPLVAGSFTGRELVLQQAPSYDAATTPRSQQPNFALRHSLLNPMQASERPKITQIAD